MTFERQLNPLTEQFSSVTFAKKTDKTIQISICMHIACFELDKTRGSSLVSCVALIDFSVSFGISVTSLLSLLRASTIHRSIATSSVLVIGLNASLRMHRQALQINPVIYGFLRLYNTLNMVEWERVEDSGNSTAVF